MQMSPKQLAANRANAQKSTGPTSIAGKKRSSQNARRHGITAQTTVMTEEDRIKHDDFCNKMIASLAPVGPMETFLASSVAEEAWRLDYVRAQCNNIIAIGHFDGTGDNFSAEHPETHTAITAAQTVRDNAKNLQLMSLYEQRIHRAFQKHFEQLRQFQAERKAQRAVDLDNARLLSQLAKLQNLLYNPSDERFDFSNAEPKKRIWPIESTKNSMTCPKRPNQTRWGGPPGPQNGSCRPMPTSANAPLNMNSLYSTA